MEKDLDVTPTGAGTTEPEKRDRFRPWLRACQMNRWMSERPGLQPSYRSGGQDLLQQPLGCPDHVLTSEHPGAAGARCSWGSAALCQRVAADDQC